MRNKLTSLFAKTTGPQIAIGASLLLCAFFIGFFVLINLGMTPIADDYIFYGLMQQERSLSSIILNYDELTGRYSNAFILIFSILLLGKYAIAAIPLLSLVVLLIGTFGTVYKLSSLFRSLAKDMTRRIALSSIAVFVIIGGLITSPSIFDVYFWYSAATVYITSAAFTSIATFIMASAVTSGKVRWSHYAWFTIMCIIAVGFYELVPICYVLIGASALTMLLIPRLKKLRLVKKSAPFAAIAVGTGIIGGLLIMSTEWYKARSAAQTSSIEYIPEKILFHMKLVPDMIINWRVFIPLLIGILLYFALPRIVKLKPTAWLLAISVFLIIVPPAFLGALMSYSGSIEPTGQGPYRVLYLATSLILVGLSMIVYVVCCQFGARVKIFNKYLLPFSFVAVLVLAVLASTYSLGKVAQAVFVRKSMMEYRQSIITSDLTTGRVPVRLLPAPILIPNSQPYDVSYGGPSKQIWINDWVRRYYGISEQTPTEIPIKNTYGYCTDFSESVTYNKQDCDQIIDR